MTGAGAGPEAAQDFSILGEHIIVIYIILKKIIPHQIQCMLTGKFSINKYICVLSGLPYISDLTLGTESASDTATPPAAATASRRGRPTAICGMVV